MASKTRAGGSRTMEPEQAKLNAGVGVGGLPVWWVEAEGGGTCPTEQKLPVQLRD